MNETGMGSFVSNARQERSMMDRPMVARATEPLGLTQHLNVAATQIGRAHELVDTALTHLAGPVPKDESKMPTANCLMSVAAQNSDDAEGLCKKLEMVLQLLGRN